MDSFKDQYGSIWVNLDELITSICSKDINLKTKIMYEYDFSIHAIMTLYLDYFDESKGTKYIKLSGVLGLFSSLQQYVPECQIKNRYQYFKDIIESRISSTPITVYVNVVELPSMSDRLTITEVPLYRFMEAGPSEYMEYLVEFKSQKVTITFDKKEHYCYINAEQLRPLLILPSQIEALRGLNTTKVGMPDVYKILTCEDLIMVLENLEKFILLINEPVQSKEPNVYGYYRGRKQDYLC